MELGATAVRTLKVLGDGKSLLSTEQLAALSEWTLDGLGQPVDQAPDVKFPVLAGVDGLALRSAHSALTVLFLEAAKHAASSGEVGEVLEQTCGWADQERVAAVAGEQYSARLQRLRQGLKTLVPSDPELTSATWRVDHVLGDREADVPTKSDMRLLLSMEMSGDNPPLELSCTREEMQILMQRLRDMLREPLRH